MKNFLFLLLIALIVVSCDDSEINHFSMQANIDDEFYKSSDARGVVGVDGNIIIEGSTQLESLTLQLSDLAEGTYNIGRGFPNSGTYRDFDGNLYQTDTNSSGLVTISKVDRVNKTLTGTFHFSAILPEIDTVYVSKGVLYKVAYDGGDVGNPTNAGVFGAKVNNEPFLPTVVTAVETGNSLKIAGSTIAATIDITVPSNVQVGDYILPQNGYDANYQDQLGLQPTSEGKITITEHNPNSKSIKGTFNFNTDQSEITEGQFEVVYQ